MATLKNTSINDTGFFKLPTGDTASRPSSPSGREIRFNTDKGQLEQFRPEVGDWLPPNSQGVIASGGDAVYDVDVDGTTYRVHVFTTTGTSTFSVLQGGDAEYLIVAGGGGGGTSDDGSSLAGKGGLGGGGTSGIGNDAVLGNAQDGTRNTGAGGGGAGYNSGNKGGDGGPGIVIVRYPRNSSLDTEPDRTVVATQPQNFQTVRDGLVLNLDASFHSADSNTIKDLSGRGNDGILINNPSATSNSITLNGSDQRIVIPFSSDFELQQFTIEYVVQPLENTHVRPFVNRSDSQDQVRPWRILMVNPNGEFISFNLSINNNTTNVNSDSPFSIDRATVIHAIYDGSEQAIWIDGVKQQQTNSVSGTPTTTTADIEIGRNSHYDPVRFANQRMFALRIYNKPLTSLEISKNFEYNRKRFTGF